MATVGGGAGGAAGDGHNGRMPGHRNRCERERAKPLRRLQQLLIDEIDEITAVMNQDGGKSRQDSLVGTVHHCGFAQSIL